MEDSQDWGEELGNAIAGLMQTAFWGMIFYWLLSAAVAGAIAYDRQRGFWVFFFVTLLFLGPLGVGFALIAQRGEMDRLPPTPTPAKRKVVEGRQRFTCPRCGADNDIPNADTTYDCWRCEEHRKVKPKVTAAKKG
jgi:DNA-directed RNA polymerase subunit RPC12/RpoP